MRYLGIVFVLVALFSINCFAEEDSVSFATYYPAPYGVYNQMQANKMGVGDINGDSVLDDSDVPSNSSNGQLYVARSVIFKPQADLNAIKSLPNPKLGELAYAASEDKFYYQNNSGGTNNGWVPQSGGSGGSTYVAWGTTDCVAGWTKAYDGYAVFPTSGSYSVPGEVNCMAGNLPFHTAGGWVWWVQSNNYYTAGGSSEGDVRISCVLCVK
jgi:hypothetical protein